MNNRILREVTISKAVGHALWEAHACAGQWAFCAGLAMLRKALDLWSGVYRDKHNLKFDKSKGEKDNIYWRLQKIAEENKLYKDTIHIVIDELRLTANDAVHESTVCSGGQVGRYDASIVQAIRTSFGQIYQKVVDLISITMPEVDVVYSDSRCWKEEPPE